ncbi:thiolase family protein [Nocardia abscessus]|uniref:thiolase family protein n=1 Tax=Nocardia abscessus TaxID=120957 RepID=UPI0024563A54|nr:thiolase family protein [Nocardia abscessus]
MNEAVIIEAVRTPHGRRNGTLAGWHPVDLLAETLTALVDRTGIDPAIVDDVIAGCVIQIGEQAVNIGRNAVLAAGFPETVPATTIDRQCGSAQQAIHFAAQAIRSGDYDVAIAAGVESMTRVPMTSSISNDLGQDPYSDRIVARYADRGGIQGQGLAAEMISQMWGLSRTELDEFSLRSHQLAAAATAEGRFKREIIPVEGAKGVVECDEGIRPDTSLEKLGSLRSAFKPNGVITAGNASQISDGASAVLLMSAQKAAALGLKGRARVHTMSLAASDPITMLTAPIPATRKALEKSGLSISDIDVIEINEAFAPVVLGWQRELGADPEKVNPNGGAIALGHPLGASGTRLMATLLHELERRDATFGLQTMCEAGGLANATIIERL